MELKLICNKCGKEDEVDEKKSTKDWKVYKSNKQCKCGGTFELDISK